MTERTAINQQIADELDQSDWVECWQCFGQGQLAGCFEDTCCCTGDPEDPNDCCAPTCCDICKGHGGYPPART